MRAVVAALLLAFVAGCGGDTPPRPRPTAQQTGAPATGMPDGTLAYVTRDAVHAHYPAGNTVTVRRLATNEEARQPVWTPDGRYLAWTYTRGLAGGIAVHDVVERRTATWQPGGELVADLRASEAAFVFMAQGDDRLGVLDPATLLADPATKPRYVRVDVPKPRLLAAGHGHVLVASGESATARGGPETVYEVSLDGTARRLFLDGDDQPEGEVRNLAIGAAAIDAGEVEGPRLVYATGYAGADGCRPAVFVAVRLLGGRGGQVLPPALLGDDPSVVSSIAGGGEGRTVATLTNDIADCAVATRRSTAFELSGDAWTVVAQDARWAANEASGVLAVITTTGDLVVGGKKVADGVTYAAWSL